MNTNARLDHLIDKFKHDVRDLIQSAVEEEREKLMEGLRGYIGKKPKHAQFETIPKVPILPAIEDVADDSVIIVQSNPANSKDKLPCKWCTKRGEPCFRHGGTKKAYTAKSPRFVESDGRQMYCIQCKVEPIDRNNYRSDKFCSALCAGRWAAKKSKRKSRGLEPYPETPLYEPVQVIIAKPSKKNVEVNKSEEQLSNRPLIDFVKKKKPFLCSYCGKPCDDFYCSSHCESEDKRLKELQSRPNKSYAEIASEKGLKINKYAFDKP